MYQLCYYFYSIVILICAFLRFYFWVLFLYLLLSLLLFGVILSLFRWFWWFCVYLHCAFFSMEFLENEAESSFTQIFYQVGALLNFHLQKQCLVHIFILKICVCFVYFKKIKLLSKTCLRILFFVVVRVMPAQLMFYCVNSTNKDGNVMLSGKYFYFIRVVKGRKAFVIRGYSYYAWKSLA